jgi:hypothetical protein
MNLNTNGFKSLPSFVKKEVQVVNMKSSNVKENGLLNDFKEIE